MTLSRQYYTTLRILKSGFLNLFRNGWLTIAATAVMVVALTIIQLAVVLNATANNAIDELGRNLKASVYLADGTNDQDRRRLEQALANLEFVDSVTYISVEQAQRDLAEDFNNDTQILQAYALVGTENVLPASLQVSVNDLERMSEIESVTSQEQFQAVVDSVSLGQTDAKKTIERAASAQRFINTGSIIAATALSAVSIMIIFNTIRMAIYTRREEIQIMKLIGATPNYIRGPFLVEASLYGVIAGIIANSAVYSLIFILGGKVSEQAEFSATYDYFTSPATMATMLLGSILIGVLIGSLSSMLAMERHLKLKHW
jgi:cell division transport system permease protein